MIECDVVELVESESSEQSYEDLTWLDRDLPPTDNMNNIVDVSMDQWDGAKPNKGPGRTKPTK